MLNVKNFAQERSQVFLLKAGNRFMKKKNKTKQKTNTETNKSIQNKNPKSAAWNIHTTTHASSRRLQNQRILVP